MTNEVYEKALAAAIADLKRLQSQQTETEKQIVSTKQMIVSLRALLGKKSVTDQGFGLKEACLQALRGAPEPLQLGQIPQALKAIGFNLDSHASPLSSIRNTLTRMVGKEIEVTTVKGKKLYSAALDEQWRF